MIYTSYFANWRNFPEGVKIFSVARYKPTWYDYMSAEEFFPPRRLIQKQKKYMINEYIEIYTKNVLNKLNVDDMYEKYNGCIFLCYEKPSKFCHRHIISHWFNENLYSSEELPN